MSLTLLKYDQPDAFLFDGDADGTLVWRPEDSFLVLGQSNSAEKSLVIENVISDGIAVTRRPTGGEAVMLTPLTIAVTVARSFQVRIHFRDFFRVVNQRIIEALQQVGVSDLYLKGISDIAIGNKKILGSSMRNIRNRLVYHAVLNVAEDPELFERYLRHPKREPDYRTGRSHREFVTSLKAEGYDLSPDDLISVLSRSLAELHLTLSGIE